MIEIIVKNNQIIVLIKNENGEKDSKKFHWK